MDTDMHRAARLLVEKCGFEVFPVWGAKADGSCACGDANCASPQKHPHRSAPHGVKDATSNPSQIDRWWALGNYNIGLACGGGSGITVVDIDERSGGLNSWANLQKRHGEVADTWMAQSGGGGLHAYFRYVEGIRNRTGMVPGIDLKNDGGYVIAPPSSHQSGNPYEWIDDLKPSASFQYPDHMPDWLLKLAGGDTQNRERAATVTGNIKEGGRNNILASLAGSMRRRGMEEDEIYAALAVVNRNRCEPPLPDKEVGTIAWSIARLPPAAAEHGAMKYGGT